MFSVIHFRKPLTDEEHTALKDIQEVKIQHKRGQVQWVKQKRELEAKECLQ